MNNFTQLINKFVYLLTILSLTLPVAATVPTDTDPNSTVDLFNMSLEQLMDVRISLASKKEEKLFDTPAAAYVITSEDIRRSGATSIPELLRMVPGLEVAQVNSNTWAITSRGFNSEFSNKLLVMIDGRSIYTPQYGGVYWSHHDVMLEDIEKIEVIRGPGGTIWGSNAVNGIINIVSKKAKETQGNLISGGGGTAEQGFGAIRIGGKVSENTYYRIYSKYFNRDDGPQLSGENGMNQWDSFRAGFRIDWEQSEYDMFTLQGDTNKGHIERHGIANSLTSPWSTPYNDKFIKSGTNILGRWTHFFDDGSQMSLQAYYDKTEWREEVLTEVRDTYDIEFQHNFNPFENHDLTWGAGYRFTSDNTEGSYNYSLDPDDEELDLYSAYIQDQITLVKEKCKLILGSKFEHNDYSGFEPQPSGRIVWTPNQNNTIWASVTKAVRSPVRYDVDSTNVRTVIPPGTVIASYGSSNFTSEKLTAYELGYRIKPSHKLFFDIAAFYNDYDDLRTFETSNVIDNKMRGETYGTEVAATYEVNDKWKLNAAYTFLQMQLHPQSTSVYTSDFSIEGKSPHNQFHIRSYMDLAENIELDLALKYVDNLPAADIPSYVRLDLRLGWYINKDMELSIVAQNLLDSKHHEFNMSNPNVTTEIERSVYAKLTCKF